MPRNRSYVSGKPVRRKTEGHGQNGEVERGPELVYEYLIFRSLLSKSSSSTALKTKTEDLQAKTRSRKEYDGLGERRGQKLKESKSTPLLAVANAPLPDAPLRCSSKSHSPARGPLRDGECIKQRGVTPLGEKSLRPRNPTESVSTKSKQKEPPVPSAAAETELRRTSLGFAKRNLKESTSRPEPKSTAADKPVGESTRDEPKDESSSGGCLTTTDAPQTLLKTTTALDQASAAHLAALEHPQAMAGVPTQEAPTPLSQGPELLGAAPGARAPSTPTDSTSALSRVEAEPPSQQPQTTAPARVAELPPEATPPPGEGPPVTAPAPFSSTTKPHSQSVTQNESLAPVRVPLSGHRQETTPMAGTATSRRSPPKNPPPPARTCLKRADKPARTQAAAPATTRKTVKFSHETVYTVSVAPGNLLRPLRKSSCWARRPRTGMPYPVQSTEFKDRPAAEVKAGWGWRREEKLRKAIKMKEERQEAVRRYWLRSEAEAAERLGGALGIPKRLLAVTAQGKGGTGKTREVARPEAAMRVREFLSILRGEMKRDSKSCGRRAGRSASCSGQKPVFR